MLTHRNLESNGRMGEAWINPVMTRLFTRFAAVPRLRYDPGRDDCVAVPCPPGAVPDRGHGPDFEGDEEDPPDHSSCGSAGVSPPDG